MKSREDLLAFYVSYYAIPAGPSNLSPEICYFMYRTRAFARWVLAHHLSDRELAVCNVGIGQGDWDLFLSFETATRGTLTSIEMREESCEVLTSRMALQQHPHEIDVRNEDVRSTSVAPMAYDLLTVIGSTVKESGDYNRTLEACARLIRPGGLLLYSDFPKYHALEQFTDFAARQSLMVMESVEEANPGLPFYLVLARKAPAEG